MQTSFPRFVLAVLATGMLCLCLSVAQPDVKKVPGREGQVTQMMFSSESKQLAAVYYIPPRNRPGTDWNAWAVTWDLSTGKPTVMPDGIGPLAFSPDGKTLACGNYSRSREPAFRSLPYVRIALWKVGEASPASVFDAPKVEEKSNTPAGKKPSVTFATSVIAAAFHPDGKHLAVAGVEELWWQPLEGNVKPQLIAPIQLASQRAPWNETPVKLSFEDKGKTLKANGMTLRKTGEGLTEGKPLSVSWHVDMNETGTTFKEVGREELKGTTPLPERNAAVVNPDGTKKATAGSNGAIKITDASTGKVLLTLSRSE